ncbi:hypothetical protein [Mesorhizobium sp. CAU 1732]|uniref:hypothetical protein n=1 Tax=Mesorhizobium sp. CAU 1732 TaxID=3140358 RepID=UPI003260E5F2
MTRLFVLGAASLAAWFAACPAQAEDAAIKIAEAFCAARVADDEAATLNLMTPSLRQAVQDAQARNQVLADANPTEKPPFGDGIPYQAFPDAAPICKAGDTGELGGQTTIQVRYEFPDEPSGSWTDRLVLADGDALIDDVVYQQFPTDSQLYGLRRGLREAFDQY